MVFRYKSEIFKYHNVKNTFNENTRNLNISYVSWILCSSSTFRVTCYTLAWRQIVRNIGSYHWMEYIASYVKRSLGWCIRIAGSGHAKRNVESGSLLLKSSFFRCIKITEYLPKMSTLVARLVNITYSAGELPLWVVTMTSYLSLVFISYERDRCCLIVLSKVCRYCGTNLNFYYIAITWRKCSNAVPT